MSEEYKCQFCGYAPPNIRDENGKDTGEPEPWPEGSCPRRIQPAPAACGLNLEEMEGVRAEPLITDPDYNTQDDLMSLVRTEGPHISNLKKLDIVEPPSTPSTGTQSPPTSGLNLA